MSHAELSAHRERIVDALAAIRANLAELAASDTAFAPRAAAALEWLDEHTRDEEPADDG